MMQRFLAIAAAGGLMLSVAGLAGASDCHEWWCERPETPTTSITIHNDDVKVIAEATATSNTGGNVQTVVGSTHPTFSWWGHTPSTALSQSMTTGPASTQALVDKIQVGTALLPSCGCTKAMTISVTNDDMFVKGEATAASLTGGNVQTVTPMAVTTAQGMVTGGTTALSGVNLISVGYTDFSVTP